MRIKTDSPVTKKARLDCCIMYFMHLYYINPMSVICFVSLKVKLIEFKHIAAVALCFVDDERLPIFLRKVLEITRISFLLHNTLDECCICYGNFARLFIHPLVTLLVCVT